VDNAVRGGDIDLPAFNTAVIIVILEDTALVQDRLANHDSLSNNSVRHASLTDAKDVYANVRRGRAPCGVRVAKS
jgi:hypothetical protein